MAKSSFTMYLHGDKEYNADLAHEIWEDPATAERMYLNGFKYTLSEVRCEVEVDLETGETKLLSAEET